MPYHYISNITTMLRSENTYLKTLTMNFLTNLVDDAAYLPGGSAADLGFWTTGVSDVDLVFWSNDATTADSGP